MIRLPDNINPPQTARDTLANYQSAVDMVGDYAAQVEKARVQFSSCNKKGNPTFDAVKVALTQMCSGARRCCYCEDSCADEVEHIWPKNFFPELVFTWTNYLYACGPCNGPKNNGFAIFTKSRVQEIVRGKDNPVVAPPIGDPILIDPRREDPLEYLILDFQTWRFGPRHPIDAKEGRRALYTIELLNLNDRGGDVLTKARADAYEDYFAHLTEYIDRRDRGLDTTRKIRTIQHRQHPTVWREMQRQHHDYPEIEEIFTAAPEALTW